MSKELEELLKKIKKPIERKGNKIYIRKTVKNENTTLHR